MLSLAGGEPWPVTRLRRAPVDFRWQDGDHLVFAAAEAPEALELERKKEKDTAEVVEDPATPYVRLFRLALDGGKVERLTENRDWIDGFELSPDGRWAVTRHQRSLSFEYDHRVTPAARPFIAPATLVGFPQVGPRKSVGAGVIAIEACGHHRLASCCCFKASTWAADAGSGELPMTELYSQRIGATLSLRHLW